MDLGCVKVDHVVECLLGEQAVAVSGALLISFDVELPTAHKDRNPMKIHVPLDQPALSAATPQLY